MKEREILKQIHSLKNIKPEAEWMESSRSVLLSQISGQSEVIELTLWQKIFDCQFVEWVSQPATIILAVLLVLVGGGASGMIVAQNTKPGDSLYVAKMISEKTRATIAMNEQDKVKLNMEFASNRVKEIEQLLCDASQPTENNAKKVAELEDNFKKELATAKERIVNIEKKQVAKDTQSTKTEKPIAKTQPDPKDSGSQALFSANLGKSKEGMQTSENTGGNIGSCQNPAQSTSTKAILDEAEKLFSDKDYKGAVDKLEQAGETLKTGIEIKTENNQASSTK